MTAITIIIKGPYFVFGDYDLEKIFLQSGINFVNVDHHQVSIAIPCST